MSGMGALKELLAKNLFLDCHGLATLKEKGKDAKLKQVKISGLTNDSLLIKLDEYEQEESRNLFAGKRGELKRCDYLLLTKIAGTSKLIFIEIKSGFVNDTEIYEKFKASECVIDYCGAALKRFYEEDNFFRDFEKRFVVFYKPIQYSKTATRFNKNKNFHSRQNFGKSVETYLKHPCKSEKNSFDIERILI